MSYLEEHINAYEKNKEIYGEIIEDIHEEEYDNAEFNDIGDEEIEFRDDDSILRLLRKKYKVLMNEIMQRNENDFKHKGDYYYPRSDKAFLKLLLKEAVHDDNTYDIVRWFNGKIDMTKSENSIEIYEKLEELSKWDVILGEMSEATRDEWLRTIAASIHYNTSKHIINIKDRLERFQNESLAINQEIGIGDIIIENGNQREYLLKAKPEKEIFVEDKTIGELLESANTAREYFNLIDVILDLIEDDANKKSIEKIKRFAKIKKDLGLTKVSQIEGEDFYNTIASEYSILFHNIYKFLLNKPELVKQIEEEYETADLLEFFNV